MAKSILSTDIISIGLLLSDGNIDITMEELEGKVNIWQTQNNRIFGVSDNDYLNSLLMLVMSDLNLQNGINSFYKLTFREIIPRIHDYNEVYFNDEGEHWMETVEYEDSGLSRFFGLTRKAYKAKMQTKEAMHVFFENSKTGLINSSPINDFLIVQGVTDQLLVDCSDAWQFYQHSAKSEI